MVLGELLQSIWNPSQKEDKLTSIGISQGAQYKSYKSDKVNHLQPSLQLISESNGFSKNNNASLSKNKSIFEGFEGMIGPTQANEKNDKEANEYTTLEDKFNSSLSDYAKAQQNLMNKAQGYIQSTASTPQRNKNIYTIEAQKTADINPKWKGCYAGGKGLIYQEDMGNTASVSACKTRASDLGYSNFALTNTNNGLSKCYIGNIQEDTLANKSVVSYSFSLNKDANMGGLLNNGQIGTYKDNISTNLITDLQAVNGCDAQVGGLINTKNTVASYGANCTNTKTK